MEVPDGRSMKIAAFISGAQFGRSTRMRPKSLTVLILGRGPSCVHCKGRWEQRSLSKLSRFSYGLWSSTAGFYVPVTWGATAWTSKGTGKYPILHGPRYKTLPIYIVAAAAEKLQGVEEILNRSCSKPASATDPALPPHSSIVGRTVTATK